jgi:threonine dehydrogenase-like Zn-dependent dehydrogenase
MCRQGLQSQCETTQNRDTGFGASLFGYTKLYGQVPGGQAEYLRVPFGNTLPITVPDGPPDDRFVYLSDVVPTSWQAVQYAATPKDGTLLVLGLGPIGDMSSRIARHLGVEKVYAADVVPERLARARARGIETIDSTDQADVVEAIRDATDGRGPDAVIDAVGMEAHGSPVAQIAQKATGIIPDAIMEKVMLVAGVDRLAALNTAIEAVRRGGTISLSGVYGGATDPMPLSRMFDKQIQLRMGQANVWRWIPEILPLLVDGDPLGVDDFATHRVPLEQAPEAYANFREKKDGAVKVLLKP